MALHRRILSAPLVACAASPGAGPSPRPAEAPSAPWPPDDAARGIDDARRVIDVFEKQLAQPIALPVLRRQLGTYIDQALAAVE